IHRGPGLAEAAQQSGRSGEVLADDDELLPRPRDSHRHARARDGAVARSRLRMDAAQRVQRIDVLLPSAESGAGARRANRVLMSEQPEGEQTRIRRLRRIVIGKARNVSDPEIFHHTTLIAFLAWVGLGADGLSSSSYG